MRVLITGATGFIGRALVPRLQRDGHTITVWARSSARARARLGADVEIVEGAPQSPAVASALRQAEAIVNFAGEPLVGKRWTADRRRVLESSRIDFTASLVEAMTAADARPSVFVSGSAVGYYGDRGGEELTEASTAGDDFLARLCVKWEAAAHKADALGARVVVIRTGVVLGRAGGALAQMLTPFKLGGGGPIGSGRQNLPWIHLHDFVAIIASALHDPRYAGPINAVAPEAATSRDFARTLGRALRRPAIVPTPALALQMLFGESASVLLASQRVSPRELSRLGFSWAFPTLDRALEDIVSTRAATIVSRSTYELHTRLLVDAPLDDTFAFFSKAENLGLLTPATMKFAIDGVPPPMRAGAQIDYRLAIGPVPVKWRSRITSWEPEREFVDVQEVGPYKSWRHHHTFVSEGRRTIMEDHVAYAPPLGLLGRIVHMIFIGPALRGIFQYRRDVIRLRFGTTEIG